jgi:hypothetical protein
MPSCSPSASTASAGDRGGPAVGDPSAGAGPDPDITSLPTLNTPPNTPPNSGSVVNLAPPGDPPDLAWDSTYNPYAYSWSAGATQLVNTVTDSFGQADQLTGTPRLTLGHVFGNGWGVQGR